jgi:hypothetical protein
MIVLLRENLLIPLSGRIQDPVFEQVHAFAPVVLTKQPPMWHSYCCCVAGLHRKVLMQKFTGVFAALFAICFLSFPAKAEDSSIAGQSNSYWKFAAFPSNPAGSNQTTNSPTPSANSQTRGSLPRVSTVQPAPLAGREKWHYYLRSTYGPKSFGYTIAGAGIKQAQGSVPEWGGGMEGYSKRFASSFSQKVVNQSIRIGLNGLLREDPRYFASGRSGIWSRTLCAAGQTLVSHKDSGETRFAYSRFAGDFGAAYVSRQWHPDSYHTTGDYLTSGFSSVGIDAAKNIFSEFWPDIRKWLHH